MQNSTRRKAGFVGLVVAGLFVAGLVSATIVQEKNRINTLSFVDQNGEPFSLGDMIGKPVILNYVFTGCSVYCPVQVGSLRALQERMNERFGNDKYQLLSVTLTPESDTAADMKLYAEQFSVNLDNWIFATGSGEDVDALIKASKAKVVKWGDDYELEHTTYIYMLNKSGELDHQFDGIPLDNMSITNALEAEIQKI